MKTNLGIFTTYRTLAALVFAVGLLVVSVATSKAAYPDHAVRVVCPYPPGGGLDLVMRAIAKKLSERWGQPVIIENRPGAATTLGTAIVARATPDGYTLLSADLSFSIGASLYKNLTYDPLKDFAPIVMANWVSNVFVVHPSVPVKTLGEFISYAKAHSGNLRYATGGSATLPNLGMVMFMGETGVKMDQIPYRGSGGSMMSMINGVEDAYIGALGSVIPYIQSGQLRPLAVLDPHRSKLLPNVPTIVEAGLPNLEARSWYGLLAPAGTDPAIIKKINDDVAGTLGSPEVQQVLTTLGDEESGMNSAEFAAFLKDNLRKWNDVVHLAGVTPE